MVVESRRRRYVVRHICKVRFFFACYQGKGPPVVGDMMLYVAQSWLAGIFSVECQGMLPGLEARQGQLMLDWKKTDGIVLLWQSKVGVR